MKKFLKPPTWIAVVAAALSIGQARAADKVYDEAGGVVVVEAEHFSTRVANTDDPLGTGIPHHWHITPDEDGVTSADHPWGDSLDANQRANARGSYIVSLPDSGENKNSGPDIVGIPEYVEYKVNINTPGTYNLYVRWGGFDGSSDSMYTQIREAIGNPSIGPDWYRMVGNNAADFNALADNGWTGWDPKGAPSTDTANRNGGGGGEVPAVFNLKKGVYTIRLSQREDGSAVDAVMLQLSSLAAPASPGPAESALATFYISQQPTDQVATPGNTATFTVGVVAPGAVTYQWQSKAPGAASFSNVASGGTSASYTTPATTDTMNGTQYQVIVTSGANSVTSNAATLSTDATPPTIVFALGKYDRSGVTVTFSEKLDKASAETVGNYAINNGVTVSAASLDASGKVVTLTTTGQTDATKYTLTVNGVKDVAGNAATGATINFEGATLTVGGLREDYWGGISGNTVDLLTGDPRYPATPDKVLFWSNFGPYTAGNNQGDNFGERVYGWLLPPVTGDYKFYLRSDDGGELDLSTDDTEAGLVKIAEQTGCCNAFTDAEGTLSSTPIHLEAGKKYFISGLHKEGGGDDYIQVGWRTPNDSNLNLPPSGVIPGKYLATVVDPTGSVTFTQQPADASVPASTPASFTVAYTAVSAFGSAASVQWQKAPSGSSTFADVAGATGTTLNIPFAAASDNGAKYRAAVTAGGSTFDSQAATLNVSGDTVVPTVKSVSGTSTTVTVVFSEPMDKATAENKANYTINNGASITGATLSADGTSVALAVSGAQAGTSYNLGINGLKDLAGNPLANVTKAFSPFDIFFDFNGDVPAGATLTGSATMIPSGSYDGSGYLELTHNVNSQQGTIGIDDVTAGKDVTSFTAFFKLFIGNGSGNAADGLSFNIASDIDPTTVNVGEDGTGSGLSVDFDTYDNGGNEAPSIAVEWGGSEVASLNSAGQPPVTKAILVNTRWVDVAIQWDCDTATGIGHATVVHDNIIYFNNLEISGCTAITGPKIAIGGRTGGENENQWIDDLRVVYNAKVSLNLPPAISSRIPVPNSTIGVPDLIGVTIQNQDLSVDASSITLSLDGTAVAATVTPSATGASVNFKPSLIQGTKHTVTLGYKDTAGKAYTDSWSYTVGPFTTSTLFIEAEDADFGAGLFVTDQKIGMDGPYPGGSYAGLGTAADLSIDWFTNDNAQQAYRPDTGIAGGKQKGSAGNDRGYFTVSDWWTVGWNDAGEWYNYTRVFPAPAKQYKVYGHLSSGGNPINIQVDKITAGVGQDDAQQTKELVGFFNPGRATAGWDSLEIFPLVDASGKQVVVSLSGQTTLRATMLPGSAEDMDYFAFVPVTAPFISAVDVNFGGVTVSIQDVPGGTAADPNSVSVTVNGKPVTTTATKTGATTTATGSLSLLTLKANVAITYKDTAGNTYSETRDVALPYWTKDTLWIEAEDADFGVAQTDGSILHAQYVTDQKIGMDGPYPGGSYAGLGTADDKGFDWNTNDNAAQAYRPDTGIAAGKQKGSAGNDRGYFTVDDWWTVGWNDAGEWYNYTRAFPTPAKQYLVFGHLASGGTPINIELDKITAGVGEADAAQAKQLVGYFRPGRATAGWDSLEMFQLTDANGGPVIVELSGKTTLRATMLPGSNEDMDFFAFTPLTFEAPSVTITSPADGATFPAGANITATVKVTGNIQKVTYYANGSKLADVTTAPFSLTVPSVATGAYTVSATATDAGGTVVSSPAIKIIVGTPKKILFVTTDPGPLSFPGDQAVLAHLQSRAFDVRLSTGTALPDDGSGGDGYDLVIISSSLGSGTVANKLQGSATPVMDWESALTDNFQFQADDTTKGTTGGMTAINIVDAASPLAAGLSAGSHTVVTSAGETFSWATPLGDAKIVATMTDDSTHANIFWYEKGGTGFNGFVMPARRGFFFLQDNTAAALNADGWKLFDAEVDLLLQPPGGQPQQPVLTVTRSGNQVTITWTNGGTLESADKVDGPYTTTGNSSGTFPTTSSGAAKFYRVKK